MEIYIARRYFRMTWAEWKNQPWYERHALLAGLRREGIISNGSAESPAETSQTIDLAVAGDDAFMGLGIPVTYVG